MSGPRRETSRPKREACGGRRAMGSGKGERVASRREIRWGSGEMDRGRDEMNSGGDASRRPAQLHRPGRSLGARRSESPPIVKRRSEAAARQENKDSRFRPSPSRPAGPQHLRAAASEQIFVRLGHSRLRSRMTHGSPCFPTLCVASSQLAKSLMNSSEKSHRYPGPLFAKGWPKCFAGIAEVSMAFRPK